MNQDPIRLNVKVPKVISDHPVEGNAALDTTLRSFLIRLSVTFPSNREMEITTTNRKKIGLEETVQSLLSNYKNTKKVYKVKLTYKKLRQAISVAAVDDLNSVSNGHLSGESAVLPTFARRRRLEVAVNDNKPQRLRRSARLAAMSQNLGPITNLKTKLMPSSLQARESSSNKMEMFKSMYFDNYDDETSLSNPSYRFWLINILLLTTIVAVSYWSMFFAGLLSK